MGIVTEMLTENLIDLNCDDISLVDFISKKSRELLRLGYVEESYKRALLTREEEYPTGLELEHTAIAIPHTTVDHIKKPFVYLNKLNKQKIKFIQMGTDDVDVKPYYILMLGIKEPSQQVTLLAELMELFSNESFIKAIDDATTKEEIINVFKKF